MDLFAQRRDVKAPHVARITSWVRELLVLDPDVAVLVTELHCTEPGCPPIETVIAVLAEGAPRQYKLHRAMADVTCDDIVALAPPARGN